MMSEKSAKKKKQLFSVLRITLLTMVAVVIGVNIYLWNARSLMGNTMPMPFGYGCAVVLSGSMEPTLQVDDLILVKKQDDFQVDDIVVFQADGNLVVHRLIELNGETAVTKGDANNASDEPISKEQLIGCVVGRLPKMGVLTRFLKTPVGVLLLLGGALLLLEMSFRSEKKEGDEKVEQLKAEIRRLREEQEGGAQNETKE